MGRRPEGIADPFRMDTATYWARGPTKGKPSNNLQSQKLYFYHNK